MVFQGAKGFILDLPACSCSSHQSDREGFARANVRRSKMKLSFHGADRRVTGSCHLVECNGRRILIDCGRYQGGRELNGGEHRTVRLQPSRYRLRAPDPRTSGSLRSTAAVIQPRLPRRGGDHCCQPWSSAPTWPMGMMTQCSTSPDI